MNLEGVQEEGGIMSKLTNAPVRPLAIVDQLFVPYFFTSLRMSESSFLDHSLSSRGATVVFQRWAHSAAVLPGSRPATSSQICGSSKCT